MTYQISSYQTNKKHKKKLGPGISCNHDILLCPDVTHPHLPAWVRDLYLSTYLLTGRDPCVMTGKTWHMMISALLCKRLKGKLSSHEMKILIIPSFS